MTGSMGEPNHSPSYQPKKPIKVVCISDLHEKWARGTLQAEDFPSGDILLVAGDLTYKGDYAKYIEFNQWLEELVFEHVVVIPGNHDITFETSWERSEALLWNAKCLNQESVTLKDLHIYGEPRQPEFYSWAYNVPRHRMNAVWSKVPTDADVLLTHGPPLGAGDLTVRGEHVGCEYQRAWIEKHQPRLVVCGHIHNGYGIHMIGNTLVVNASVCNEKYDAVNAPIVVHL